MCADLNHVEILRSGPAAWNVWREKNPSTVPDLAGIALSLGERQVCPSNGRPINLKSARLEDTTFHFATLVAADLEAASMSRADLLHARLRQANLAAANLSHARLDYSDLSEANLTQANLRGASLRFATLSNANLEAACFSGADLAYAQFGHANLGSANLSGARLDYADFAGANLKKTNLRGASLQHAKNLTSQQLEESQGNASTILPPHLQVSWSVARRQTVARERCDPTTKVNVRRESTYKTPIWIAGALLALVTFSYVWKNIGEVVPLTISSTPRESLTELSPHVRHHGAGLFVTCS